MGQERVIRPRKSKLQDLHSRQAELLAQCNHIRGDYAQVFCNDRQVVPQARPHCAEEIIPGAGYPATLLGGRVSRRDLPVAGETSKMVDANDIDCFQGRAQPFKPPQVTTGFVGFPAVKRVAP